MSASFDVEKVRRDFPVLDQKIRKKPLIYLDSGASAQKPLQVLDAMRALDAKDYANVHRGVHTLSQRSTSAYEAVRGKAQRFLNAKDEHEVIFTTGTTQGINLVAQTYGRRFLKEGDEVVVSEMEHHANIVPWQMLCEERGCVLRVIPVLDDGTLDMEAARGLIGPRCALVAVMHVSNVLGTINPIEEIIALARKEGAVVVVDGAQAVPHLKVDVQALDVDFYAFSAHKLFGPTGVGILYGKMELLEKMPPYMGGGDMIETVSFKGTTFNKAPFKFEAGTPNITGVVGMGAALDYVASLDWEAAQEHEEALLAYALEQVQSIEGIKVLGSAPGRIGVISFSVDGVHANDIGMILDQEGIAVRTGHHCAQPLHERFGVTSTARASLSIFNTREEIDALVQGLKLAMDLLR